MATVQNSQSRILLVASLIVFSLFGVDALQAQDREPLPDYVIEEFGEPPAVPDGPLSEALQSAIEVAFIDTMKNTQ